ncbi:MAG: hypothetical protein GC129_01310 [Proteobacteria bacterium]|nr:hypothetical protein [Pseudomonadota bacterium]
MEKTSSLARKLKAEGHETWVVLLSDFKPRGKLPELEIYQQAFAQVAPELEVKAYRETNDTLGQVERSLELRDKEQAVLVFVSAWMQYPRVVYLARKEGARHYGVFGIPQPAFALIDPFCMLTYPLVEWLGLGRFFQRILLRRREEGRIL